MVDKREILSRIDELPEDHRSALIQALSKYNLANNIEQSKSNFLKFAKAVWPAFIEGPHHRIMGEKFAKVASGELKRVIINIAPRHGKSELTSWLLPAWMLGRNPARKIIAATHTAEFSVRFGRKVRNLIAGAMTGRGADLLIIDDPHSESAGINPSIEYFDSVYEWYSSGPRQRLQPGGAIIIVMTRWHQSDLTGQIVDASEKRKGADKWEVIELPALYDTGEPLWPDFWSVDELNAIKAELPQSKWLSQYQQKPTSEEGALIKREYWKEWEYQEPPACDFIIQSIDTAHTKNARSDFSAITTWGVFDYVGEDGIAKPNIILLDAVNEKLEFPELKRRAYELFEAYDPDSFLIEAKAAGLPLLQELRSSGIPVTDYTPSRGQDKLSRVNAVADIFASGMVWYPKTPWAEEVIEQCASFPRGSHDDLVDSTTLALMRFRQGGFLALPKDVEDDDEFFNINRREPWY